MVEHTQGFYGNIKEGCLAKLNKQYKHHTNANLQSGLHAEIICERADQLYYQIKLTGTSTYLAAAFTLNTIKMCLIRFD